MFKSKEFFFKRVRFDFGLWSLVWLICIYGPVRGSLNEILLDTYKR